MLTLIVVRNTGRRERNCHNAQIAENRCLRRGVMGGRCGVVCVAAGRTNVIGKARDVIGLMVDIIALMLLVKVFSHWDKMMQFATTTQGGW